MTCSHAGIDSFWAKVAADLCNGNRAAAGQAGAWAVNCWWGRLARPGRALLARSSAGGAGKGPDRAEEEDLIGFIYC